MLVSNEQLSVVVITELGKTKEALGYPFDIMRKPLRIIRKQISTI